MLNIHPIRALSDNYIWCIYDGNSAVVVDPGDSVPVIEFLLEKQLKLTAIIITHHHYDHTDGIDGLLDKYPNIPVYGPQTPKIKQITKDLKEGDRLSLLDNQLCLNVMDVPGHTLDHIAYYNNELIFCGDTLFSAGCGRMFEGTPEVFWSSLKKIKQLPKHTKVYCTHEYTQANIRFASEIDADNTLLNSYSDWVSEKRLKDEVTLPSNLKLEIEINPFLKCDNEEFVQHLKQQFELADVNPVQVFKLLRKAKDNF
ncbi:hydroxyacylglutathione hydrolase [Glaciecola sp. 1036]|uniref:hydroxyacylglutathione hydrolase n=1 Tax=Alteromonadaceae TaxID=72275 RepID=UPI003D07868B